MAVTEWISPPAALFVAAFAFLLSVLKVRKHKSVFRSIFQLRREKQQFLEAPGILDAIAAPSLNFPKVPKAKYNTKAMDSMQLYKELYHKLQHVEQYPEVLPKARDVLVALFSEKLEQASENPENGILSIQDFSREALFDFQHTEDDKVLNLWEEYLARRKAKGPRELFTTAEEAKWWLVQTSPVKYVDGAWLGHINKITTPFDLRRVAKNAWQVLSEELGDGDLEKNHVYIYRRLMETVEPGLPAGDDPDFIHPRHGLNEPEVWKAALAQLLISLFPHQFLPEIIGFNMHYEAIVLSTLKAAKELKELGFDPYYFILHISIDNADTGHTAMALEVAAEYMELIKKRDGDEAARKTWKRIQTGYLLSKGLPTAPVCPKMKSTTNPALPLTKETFPRNEYEAELIKIFKAKASVSQKIHCNSRVRFGGHTIAEWLAPGALDTDENKMTFLDAFSNTRPWVCKGDSRNSLFMKEISWQGRMFGSFTQSEVCVIEEWIDSLCGGGGSKNSKHYWGFIEEEEISSQKALQNNDIRCDHPIFTPFPANNVFAQLLPSTSHLPRAPSIDATVAIKLDVIFPLWFTHPCLLEHFVCVPTKTTSYMVCSIIRILRAQSGFSIEDAAVAGMDEVRRNECIGLVELGLEMVRGSGLMNPKCLKDVLDTWKSDFGVFMLHLCKRPTENVGLLLGLTMAFTDLHDAIALSSTMLSNESRYVLRCIAERERKNLDMCLLDLQNTQSGFLDFCRGYHLGRAEIDKCFERTPKEILL